MAFLDTSSFSTFIPQEALLQGLSLASPDQNPLITELVKRNFQLAQKLNFMHGETVLKNKKLQERNSELRKLVGNLQIVVDAKCPKLQKFFLNDVEKKAVVNSAEIRRKILRFHHAVVTGTRQEKQLQRRNCELEQENAILEKKLSERILLNPIHDMPHPSPSPELVLSPPPVTTSVSATTTPASTQCQPLHRSPSIEDELVQLTKPVPAKSDSPTSVASILSPHSPSPQIFSPSPMIISPSLSISTTSSSPSIVSPLFSPVRKLHPSPTQIEAEKHKKYHTVATDADYNRATQETIAWLINLVDVLNSRLDDMNVLFSKRDAESLETYDLFAKFLNLYVDHRYRKNIIKTFHLDKDERKILNIGIEYLGGPNKLITPLMLFLRCSNTDRFPDEVMKVWHEANLSDFHNQNFIYGKQINAEKLKNAPPLGDIKVSKK
jgi:hypothetical protein